MYRNQKMINIGDVRTGAKKINKVRGCPSALKNVNSSKHLYRNQNLNQITMKKRIRNVRANAKRLIIQSFTCLKGQSASTDVHRSTRTTDIDITERMEVNHRNRKKNNQDKRDKFCQIYVNVNISMKEWRLIIGIGRKIIRIKQTNFA